MIRLTLALLAGLTTAVSYDCPDQIVKPVPASVTFHGMQACGSTFNGNISGVEITFKPNSCPVFAIIVPAHDEAMPSSGSHTYVVPAGTYPVRRVTFACEDVWLLGIIPVVVGSRCVVSGETNAGVVTHYLQQPCDLPTALPTTPS